jgi:hypothetical protein
MTITFAALSAAHVVLAAVWLGAMTYSLVIVQPRALRLLGEQRFEDFAAVLAHGARTAVLTVMAGLALTGSALVVLPLDDARHDPLWWLLVAAKVVALLAALALFSWVSWRLWPRRIFALDTELAAVRTAFRRVAITLLALVAAQFVLGALAGAVARS